MKSKDDSTPLHGHSLHAPHHDGARPDRGGAMNEPMIAAVRRPGTEDDAPL
jgi:hypothetical protein